jgi:hypothetical protein
VRRVAIAVAVVVALACAREEHVLESDTAYPPAPSSGDVDQMCRESFLEVKGLDPKMRVNDQVEALLRKQFGGDTASTLTRAINDRHAVVRRDELFMYKASLCGMTNLPARCDEACRDAKRVTKAK